MRQVIHRMRRSLPLWLSAEDLAQTLLRSLGTGAARPGREAQLALQLRAEPDGLPAVIEEMLADPALCRRLLARQCLRRSGVDPARTPIVSLGSHCFAASLLRRWELRRWSGPFDWLFSSVPMVTHCLEDNFTAFLDRSWYDPVPVEQRLHGPRVNRVQHRLYREQFGVEHVFNHHDAHLDPDHAHFVRAAHRLRTCLAGPHAPVFVIFRTQGETPMADLLPLRDALARHCENFLILAYEVPPLPPPVLGSPRLELRHSEAKLRVFEFRPRSAWLPLQFEDPLDEHLLVTDILARTADFLGIVTPAGSAESSQTDPRALP